jgi:hypothetical protein
LLALDSSRLRDPPAPRSSYSPSCLSAPGLQC